MDSTTLKDLFQQHDKRAVDFITWMKDTYNVSITSSEMSLHVNGGRKINRWAEALYKTYFMSLD